MKWDFLTYLKMQLSNASTKIAHVRADDIMQNHCEIQNSSKAKNNNNNKKAYLHLQLFHRQPPCEMWCFCQAASLVLLHSTW